MALAKFEKVIATLGPLPDLLALAAQAAYQANRTDRAQALVTAAFAAADATFKKTLQYEGLIDLAAQLELEKGDVEAAKTAAETRAGSSAPTPDAPASWVDDRTRLMWTSKDSGSPVSGAQANRYCQDLVLAGFDDWRLPTIDELQGIYDPSRPSGAAKVKAPIQLSDGWWVWSATPGTSYSTPSAWGLFFFDGSRSEFYPERAYAALRALCVRGPG